MDPALNTPSPPDEVDIDELREELVAEAVKGIVAHDITTALIMMRAAVADMSAADVLEAARQMDADDPEGAARRTEKKKLRLRGVCSADCYLCWPGLYDGQPTTQPCGSCGRDSIYVSVVGCHCPGCEKDVCAYCHGHPYAHGDGRPAGAADDAACKRCCESCDPENGNYAHPIPRWAEGGGEETQQPEDG